MNESRRDFLKNIASIGLLAGIYGVYQANKTPYSYVKPYVKWSSNNLTDFLESLPSKDMALIKEYLGINDTVENEVSSVKKELLWNSSHIATYSFKNKENFNYHDEIIVPLANEIEVDEEYLNSYSTFFLERKIIDSIFINMWNGLSINQRIEVLKKIESGDDALGVVDPNSNVAIEDKAGVALLGGSAALAALSTTVFLSGFTFYTAMSSFIFATASVVGVTLPFSVYAGAASTVAVLSGPIGWALIGIASLGSIAFLGRAKHLENLAFVTQLHFIKVRALKEEEELDKVLDRLKLK